VPLLFIRVNNLSFTVLTVHFKISLTPMFCILKLHSVVIMKKIIFLVHRDYDISTNSVRYCLNTITSLFYLSHF